MKIQTHLNLEYINNDYFYTNNFIMFFFTYGLFSFCRSIFLLIVQIYVDLRETQEKSIQVSEIELNENVVLKKRKLI
jgi:hypothetical protein